MNFKDFFSFARRDDDYDDYPEENDQNFDYEDEEYESSDYEEESRPSLLGGRRNLSNHSRVVSMPQQRLTQNQPSGREVIIIKPTNFELTKLICDDLRSGKTVICNMQGITKETARRAADFIMGACHALSAHVEQITDGIFVVAPSVVKLGTFSPAERRTAPQPARTLPFQPKLNQNTADLSGLWPELGQRQVVNR